MCEFSSETIVEEIPEISEFPAQDTFNEDDMSIIEEGAEENVSNKDN